MTSPTPYQTGARVGIIGLGSMGAGMARCLLAKGFPLQVFARRPEVARPLEAAGAHLAASPAELAHACGIVILSLPDSIAVEQVLFASDGLASALQPGSCVIDTSTIAATPVREFAERLQQRGVWLLDAPVSGGQQGAESGTLGCMVGGSAEALAACHEVMRAFCKTITHVGESGAGQTVKACNQVAVAGALMGVADAIALAKAQGLDPSLMREVLMGGTAKSFPLEKHAPRIIAHSFTPGFRARLMRKDLRLALDTARAVGATLPTATVAEQLLDAMCEDGRADWDWCAVALEVQRLSGIDIPDASELS